MMVKPILDDLMDKVDSKYTLVSISARCARKIMEEEDVILDNPVSMALRQIAEGEITWERRDPLETVEEEVDVNAEIQE